MLQIRTILLRGSNIEDAVVTFADRANILAGESDTGKSYLVHCLDYILGADELRKRIEEAEPYSQLIVEFENSKCIAPARAALRGTMEGEDIGV
jgi:DNA repair ATPase RecN